MENLLFAVPIIFVVVVAFFSFRKIMKDFDNLESKIILTNDYAAIMNDQEFILENFDALVEIFKGGKSVYFTLNGQRHFVSSEDDLIEYLEKISKLLAENNEKFNEIGK